MPAVLAYATINGKLSIPLAESQVDGVICWVVIQDSPCSPKRSGFCTPINRFQS